MQILNIPVMGIWIWFGIRARDLFFFSNTNPIIRNGGVMGASKWRINSLLPNHLIPTSQLIDLNQDGFSGIKNVMERLGITYPVILKPDVGERGFLVEKVCSDQELLLLLQKAPKTKYILQEYIDLPHEISIMYHRIPNQRRGKITSLTIKKPLEIKGDGISTLKDLMAKYPRAKIQMGRLMQKWSERLDEVVPKDMRIILEPIGSHSRGTTFLNGNHFIDAKLESIFDQISHACQELYYGRFDIKCKSIDSVKQNEDFFILEYNGVAAEPAHIYHPGYSIFKAYRDFYRHWDIIYKIHKAQKQRGVQTISLSEAWNDVKHYFSYKKWASGKV